MLTGSTDRVWRSLRPARGRGAIALCTLAALGLLIPLPGLADPAPPPAAATQSLFGTPGQVDNPSGEALPDGELVITTAVLHGTLRNTLTFQFSPRLTGTFRYAAHGDGFWDYTNYDRSFDWNYQLLTEGAVRPSLSIGMRDFAGTGRYSSEYLVASKHIGPVTVSAGLGWGRLAGHPRPILEGADAIDTWEYWFTGSPEVFGGLRWQVSDKLSLVAEYSRDTYAVEAADFGFTRDSPWNFGASYQVRNWNLGLYYAYGTQLGFRASYALNPTRPVLPGGRDGAPPVITPRAGPASSWDRAWVRDEAGQQDMRTALAAQLAEQGLRLTALRLEGDAATAWIVNDTYGAAAQAVGRTARAMTRVLPASVEALTVVPVTQGMTTTAVTLNRSDLETLEWAADGAGEIRARAGIADGADLRPTRNERLPGAQTGFALRFSPYLSPSLFDPNAPVRVDFGLQAEASWIPRPGLIFSGALRKPLAGNLDKSLRTSDSVLPHVRSDGAEYDRQSDLELTHLTGEYFFRPGRDLYGRVTAGYLERMFGGASAEVLWMPEGQRWALGAEVNYARQRDFDILLGFRDYGVVTGHLSGYFRFNDRYFAQIDAGRYLAGDWGTTVKLERRFNNGWRVGAYMTLTDVPFDDFGEGAFDRGIYFRIPQSWLTGDPSHDGFATTLRMITRDGGARLDVRNRLYDVVGDFNDPYLSDRWGRFWR